MSFHTILAQYRLHEHNFVVHNHPLNPICSNMLLNETKLLIRASDVLHMFKTEKAYKIEFSFRYSAVFWRKKLGVLLSYIVSSKFMAYCFPLVKILSSSNAVMEELFQNLMQTHRKSLGSICKFCKTYIKSLYYLAI